MERLEFVDEDVTQTVNSPSLKGKGNIRENIAEPDVARSILERLNRFEYASKQHALILPLWRTGVRTGTVRSLDLSDYHPDDQYLDVVHRPHEDTPLKTKVGMKESIKYKKNGCSLWTIFRIILSKTRENIFVEHVNVKFHIGQVLAHTVTANWIGLLPYAR